MQRGLVRIYETARIYTVILLFLCNYVNDFQKPYCVRDENQAKSASKKKTEAENQTASAYFFIIFSVIVI